MIIGALPYCPANEGSSPKPGRDLGWAYNALMQRLRPGDWAMLYDHDMALIGPYVQQQLEACVELAESNKSLRAGLFTMVLNKALACSRWQVAPAVDVGNNHLSYHEGMALTRWRNGKRMALSNVTDFEDRSGGAPLTGLMLLSRDAWRAVGGFPEGFRFCDHTMHRRIREVGMRVFLVESFYVYHGKQGHFPPA